MPPFDGSQGYSGTLFRKLAARSLYVSRPVTNAAAIIAHYKANGFDKCVPPEEMHVTQCFSKSPMDWTKAGDSFDQLKAEGDAREMIFLGSDPEKKAAVLAFGLAELSDRFNQFKAAGASWDFDGYTPHITISYEPGDIDLSTVPPWDGPIELGPERYKEVVDDWASTITEKRARVVKVQAKLGIVIGFAIVSTIDGEEYWDLNIDEDGERVPEHIPVDAMIRTGLDFASSATRPGNLMHQGPEMGFFPFLFPFTNEILAELGGTCRIEGLAVGYCPPPELLVLYENGTLTGFSIEGVRLVSEEVG